MKIKFWGTRGSIPTPEPSMIKYGGDTSCVEISTNGTLMIFDIGTGARKLGAQLMKDPNFNGKIHLFLSHTHWDHIQGFPFFQPVYSPNTELLVHGAFRADLRLDECLEGQMSNLYFPVKMKELASRLKFVEMIEETIEIDGKIQVTAKALNHPQGCFGYRIDDGRHVVVYATDTEPYPDRPNDNLLQLCKGADVVIHDSQYTPEEYVRAKKGWGHSTWKDAADLCTEAGVKQLVLFHHDPYHDDDMIDNMVSDARKQFPNTVGATRELELELEVEDKDVDSRRLSTSISAPKGRGFKVSYVEKNGAVVFLAPEDLSLFNSKKFSETICQVVTPDHKKIVVNMARLQHIDSAGVGSLAAILDFSRKRGIPLVLSNITRNIYRVLQVTRFDKVIPVFKTEEEALK